MYLLIFLLIFCSCKNKINDSMSSSTVEEKPLEVSNGESLCETSPQIEKQKINSQQNDLINGALSGKVEFAQTHVVAANRRIFDPFLVPEREALVMFTPTSELNTPLENIKAVNLLVYLDGKIHKFNMKTPDLFPKAVKFDEKNTFSGKIIGGEYPKFRKNTFTYVIPWNLFKPNARIAFVGIGNKNTCGELDSKKYTFMKNESEGLVLMNIKGCIFIDENKCNANAYQFDIKKHPILAKIAAREIFSEIPVKHFILGLGTAYWPYVIALGSDNKPHRYSIDHALEWANFGNSMLSAKLGMGNYWITASKLGEKSQGKYVTIVGQLLDGPDNLKYLPPGVAASCGRSICNYGRAIGGFWHETGHGFGLPHSTPPRYEDWAYRSYDNKLLPNYHPDPSKYGLDKDYLGFHYFGHVLGTLEGNSWPTKTTASAPLIDEFEILKNTNSNDVQEWKTYIAPYTHQQTLQVQQRFGSLPKDKIYAGLFDDHRAAASGKSLHIQRGRNIIDPIEKIDSSVIKDIELSAVSNNNDTVNINSVKDIQPAYTGVPVHTLVVTFSTPNNKDINQIYPPILANYGDVFSPEKFNLTDNMENEHFKNNYNNFEMFVSKENGKCLERRNNTIIHEECSNNKIDQKWKINKLNTNSSYNLELKAINEELCLDNYLHLNKCNSADNNFHWSDRADLTKNINIVMLQAYKNGTFITPNKENNSVSMLGKQYRVQHYFKVKSYNMHSCILKVVYKNGNIEYRLIYRGLLFDNELITKAVNINSNDHPISASLIIDKHIEFERQLEDNQLPPPIKVGAEFNYPEIK